MHLILIITYQRLTNLYTQPVLVLCGLGLYILLLSQHLPFESYFLAKIFRIEIVFLLYLLTMAGFSSMDLMTTDTNVYLIL